MIVVCYSVETGCPAGRVPSGSGAPATNRLITRSTTRISSVTPSALCSTNRLFCSGPSGATVTLDASGSADPDSVAGTADDIVAFVWIEDADLPGERILGSGLTLDVTLQDIAETALSEAIDRLGADGGDVVMLDPRTGEILALVSRSARGASTDGDK